MRMLQAFPRVACEPEGVRVAVDGLRGKVRGQRLTFGFGAEFLHHARVEEQAAQLFRPDGDRRTEARRGHVCKERLSQLPRGGSRVEFGREVGAAHQQATAANAAFEDEAELVVAIPVVYGPDNWFDRWRQTV